MLMRPSSEDHLLNLRVGELVEVRSESEILATLDENGELENLPFMPEMLQVCGRRFRVDRPALKPYDTGCGTPSTSRACAATARPMAGVRPAASTTGRRLG